MMSLGASCRLHTSDSGTAVAATTAVVLLARAATAPASGASSWRSELRRRSAAAAAAVAGGWMLHTVVPVVAMLECLRCASLDDRRVRALDHGYGSRSLDALA